MNTFVKNNSLLISKKLELGSTPAGANSANYNRDADWNSQDGNVTAVGSNGGPSAYGTFDQNGNVSEWNDFFNPTNNKTITPGDRYFSSTIVSSSSAASRIQYVTDLESNSLGFRLSSFLNPLSLVNFVLVGDVANFPNNTSYGSVGSVNYNYYIGKYVVTNCEYVEFLNSKAKSDPYGLYNNQMGLDPRSGIMRFGTSGNYSYVVKTNMGNKPVVWISWFDCCRYCNWLHNDKENGDTETGSYTLNGIVTGSAPARNINAKYHIPTENEWYKAAYYKGGSTNAGYWAYATQSDLVPATVTANDVGDGSARISEYSCTP